MFCRAWAFDLETRPHGESGADRHRPHQKMIGNVPYTPRREKVYMAFSLQCGEAFASTLRYVGHRNTFLLGLLREGDGVCRESLEKISSVDIEECRNRTSRSRA